MRKVIVLGDGTWSEADDVVICDVEEDQFQKLRDGVEPRHLQLKGKLVLQAIREAKTVQKES